MGKNKIIATMKRFICLTLAVILLSESPSWEAIAAEPMGTYEENSSQAATNSGTWTELPDRRAANVKWYTDSAGNLKVKIYDTAVHAETEDGWQEAEWFVEASANESEDDSADTEDTENVTGDNTADTPEGSAEAATDSMAGYTAGYGPEGSEVYTYIDIPEEYLVLEGYTLYSAKINFASAIFTGYSEEAESLTVGIFLGDGQEDETEDTADTGAGESIGEDTAAIDTEATEVIDTEAIDTDATEGMDTEATEVMDTEVAEVTDAEATEVMDTEATEVIGTEADDTEVAEKGSVEEGSWETRTIKTALSELIDIPEDSTGPVSFTLNTGVLSTYISEEAQLMFAAFTGSGLLTATTADSQSGAIVPLWECIFTPSETGDNATGEDYYLVDGSINTHGINGDSEEPRIIGEIEEKRDSNTKYFLTEGGGEIAAVYPEPVHYEEDGEWLDIDNTLELKDEKGEERYHNKNSGVDVSFATSSTASELVKINAGENTISWGLAVAGPVNSTYQARTFSRQSYTARTSNACCQKTWKTVQGILWKNGWSREA